MSNLILFPAACDLSRPHINLANSYFAYLCLFSPKSYLLIQQQPLCAAYTLRTTESHISQSEISNLIVFSANGDRLMSKF